MLQQNLSSKIDELSVIARQCIAAICFERYCQFHKLQNPEIDAFIEHVWSITKIDKPEKFVEWEQGFQLLKASDWGKPLAKDILELIPANIQVEYRQLTEDVIEISAATWYGSDLNGTKQHLIKVIEVTSSYGITLPNLNKFRNSSPQINGGWGNIPSPDEINEWRYKS
jgi:hypothetical protein